MPSNTPNSSTPSKTAPTAPKAKPAKDKAPPPTPRPSASKRPNSKPSTAGSTPTSPPPNKASSPTCPQILARQHAAVATFQATRSQFQAQLKTLSDADDKNDETGRANGVVNLATWLLQNQKGKANIPTDPNNLPFRTPKGNVRPPITTPTGYQAKQALFGIKPVHLAGAIPAGGVPIAKVISPTDVPTAADLAATDDVQITPAIQAQAAALNNNPVQIHNWVRNNIEFIPSYGSIQGSDMTMQTKRGNAFDTASLEIALLRAAGIPARYVYGTIQLPADKVMNWVGGMTKPEAALGLLAQGGIPSVGVYTGGTISAVQLEHVWVEAYVNYVPSRGAVNKVGDTWIPMDPSFKQYTYTQGMDINDNVPLDVNSLLTQAQQGATVNQTEGWVQNLNQASIQAVMTNYPTQVQNYVNSQKANAAVGDVFGTKTVQQQNFSALMETLPYATLAVGNRFDAIPDSLRHKFQYSLYASATDLAYGNPIFSYQESLPNLAGKKISLTYVPATQADADLIASYLPTPHADGSPIQASEFPATLPGYLIHVVPQLTVEGLVVATGGVFTMGTQLLGQGGFTHFDFSGWD